MGAASFLPSESESLSAELVLLWLSIAVVLAILLWPGGRGRRVARQLWALAVLGFQEGLRLKVLWTALALALVCGALAYFSEADGTHAGRARLILDTCLLSGEILSAALVINLSALSVAREIEARIMHTIGAKPVSRWVLLAGKALGFWGVQLLFVFFSFALTGALTRAVPLRAESHEPGRLVRSGTWADLDRNALTTRTYTLADGSSAEKSEFKFIRPGAVRSWKFAVPDASASLPDQLSLRLVLSSTHTFAAYISGVRVTIADESGKLLLDRTETIPQGHPVEFFFDSPRSGALRLTASVAAPHAAAEAPSLIVAQPSGVRVGTTADGFLVNLTKSAALMAIQGGLLALITTAWSGVLSFAVTVALGVILLLGGELSRHVVDLLHSESLRLIEQGLQTPGNQYQSEIIKRVETVLGLLPDFHAVGGPSFFVDGTYLPWAAIAYTALWMGIVRGAGWALPGFLSFQRREVGA